MIIKEDEAKYWITETSNGFCDFDQQTKSAKMEILDTEEEYLSRLAELGREVEEMPS